MSEIFFFHIFAFHIFAFHISCSLFFDDFINDYYVFAWNILHFYKIWQWKGNSLGFDCVNIMKWIILCIWQLGIVIETNCDISPLMFFLRPILAATEKKYSKLCELYLKLQVASFFSTRNSNNTCLHVPNNHRGNRRHDSRRSTTHTGCHDTNLSRRSYVGQYKWHCQSSRPISRCHHGSEFLGVIVHRSGHFRENL